MDATFVRRLGLEHAPGNRTAQYVAVNDGSRNLVMAMADMNIFSHNSFPAEWKAMIAATKPEWLVVDANWSAKDIRNWIKAGKEAATATTKVAFEPVSAEKSRLLFGPQGGQYKLRMYPEASVDLASPNTYELAAMFGEAKDNGYLDDMEWFEIVDAFGMRGARERFVRLTSPELTDAGVPIQSVQLLPYIPTIITKLGEKGALLTSIIKKDDPLLYDRDEAEFILTRAPPDHPTGVGGIYMRLFPAAEKVDEVVSVNGVGDTFLGVLISGLAQGGRVEKLIDVAQKGAVMSLKCAESVSAELPKLEGRITESL